MNPVHVECVKPIYNIQALSINKNISINFANGSYQSILSRSKTLYWAGWEPILVSYLYYVEFDRLKRMRINENE